MEGMFPILNPRLIDLYRGDMYIYIWYAPQDQWLLVVTCMYMRITSCFVRMYTAMHITSCAYELYICVQHHMICVRLHPHDLRYCKIIRQPICFRQAPARRQKNWSCRARRSGRGWIRGVPCYVRCSAEGRMCLQVRSRIVQVYAY